MEYVIELKNVDKEFKVLNRHEGLKGSFQDLFSRDYKFRDVYFLATAAEDEEDVDEKAAAGLQGWVDCFEKAEFKGKVFAGGVNDCGEIEGHKALTKAYEMGKRL